MSTFFSVVGQNVARNPVTRAVQRARMKSELRDFAITLYNLPDGEEQADILMAAAQVLTVAIRVGETTATTQMMPILRGALSAIQERSNHGFRWRSRDAVALDYGMDCARQILAEAKAQTVQDAWWYVAKLDEATA